MALNIDLRRLLQKKFHGAKTKLAMFEGDRVGGTLIWDGFEGMAQIDRQQQLRQIIAELPPEQQLKVSFILTITADELAEMIKV